MLEGIPLEAQELSSNPESNLPAGSSLGDLLALLGSNDFRHMAQINY